MGANAGMTPPAEVLDQRYPARRILDLIGSRWTPVVLYCLSQEVGRFNEMQRRIPDISKKMLTHTLRNLEPGFPRWIGVHPAQRARFGSWISNLPRVGNARSWWVQRVKGK